MGTVRLDEFGSDYGLIHEAVVTGRKIATPGELRMFFSKLAHDENLFNSLLDSALNRVGLTAAEHLAVEILGEGKVIGYKDVHRVWQRDLPEVEPAFPYAEEILNMVAERNQNGEDWRLVYCTGLSLRAQLEVMGDNRKKQPCFEKDYTWWRESQQDEWANKPIEPGYRLLDFSCRFTSMNWQAQNDAITASGEQFARAEEQAVAEVCFSNYAMNGRRLLQGRYHWGHLQTANGHLVCVVRFGGNGFYVYHYWDDDDSVFLGAVRVWKSSCPS